MNYSRAQTVIRAQTSGQWVRQRRLNLWRVQRMKLNKCAWRRRLRGKRQRNKFWKWRFVGQKCYLWRMIAVMERSHKSMTTILEHRWYTLALRASLSKATDLIALFTATSFSAPNSNLTPTPKSPLPASSPASSWASPLSLLSSPWLCTWVSPPRAALALFTCLFLSLFVAMKLCLSAVPHSHFIFCMTPGNKWYLRNRYKECLKMPMKSVQSISMNSVMMMISGMRIKKWLIKCIWMSLGTWLFKQMCKSNMKGSVKWRWTRF